MFLPCIQEEDVNKDNLRCCQIISEEVYSIFSEAKVCAVRLQSFAFHGKQVRKTKDCFLKKLLPAEIACMSSLTENVEAKNSPLFCMCVDGRLFKQLKHCRCKTYDVSCRLVSLSGDVEKNPGPSDNCSADTSSRSLLETRLCELHLM